MGEPEPPNLPPVVGYAGPATPRLPRPPRAPWPTEAKAAAWAVVFVLFGGVAGPWSAMAVVCAVGVLGCGVVWVVLRMRRAARFGWPFAVRRVAAMAALLAAAAFAVSAQVPVVDIYGYWWRVPPVAKACFRLTVIAVAVFAVAGAFDDVIRRRPKRAPTPRPPGLPSPPACE